MAISLFSLFGKKQQPQPVAKPVVADKPVPALPGPWYTSEELYQLERRAIFQRKWILVTHQLRFPNTGDWQHYEVANYDFVLRRDQDGDIHAIRGARDIQETGDGLPIHIHVDHNDFIWINLDPRETPEISWDSEFKGADQQPRYGDLKFTDFVFDHSWEMTGDYNWKILSDNYNECYHCATTHPDLVGLTNLEAYEVVPKGNHLEHYVATRPEQEARGYRVHPTYFFPTTSMNISRHFFMMQRFVPVGPVKSIMRYEVYRNPTSSPDEFEEINQIYKRVMSEDKVLCERSQRNINAGVFVNGELHPRLEMGPLWFQSLCRENVLSYNAREEVERQQASMALLYSLSGSRQIPGSFEDHSIQPSHQVAVY